MKYLSVCSGIEAATVAWHPLGWQAAAFSEIDKFPAAVLAHHYPTVPNLGDMTRFKEWNDATLDVFVGGTPCQSFSVAGLRKGLDDPRGNLMLTYLAIADRYRPRWLVWENVPGVLSSNGGRDFGTFLGGLGQLGYGFAYRVLDAQYFGVPQRRRRVFVVGYLGDWRRAAAVLFERHSLSGHPAPCREKREGFAGSLAASSGGCNDENRAGAFVPVGIDEECNATIDGFGPLLRGGQGGTRQAVMCMATGQGNAEVVSDGSPSLTCNHEAPIVTHALTRRYDSSEDGCGRGTPLVPVKSYRTSGNCGAWDTGDRTDALTTGTDPNSHILAFNLRGREGGAMPEVSELASLRAASGGSSRSYIAHTAVRRLTPEECESLQGFPRGYTNIPWGKKECPDGPRYKALGNSMAVPVMSWIGQRIQMVENIGRE